MKLKKVVLIIVIMLFIFMCIFGQVNSNAEGEIIEVWRRQYNNSWSYSIYDSMITWDLYMKEAPERTFYCINAGFGDEWNNRATKFESVKYTSALDMHDDKDEIISKLSNINSDNYNSIVWILENMYIPNEYSNDVDKNIAKTMLLNKAGIFYGTKEDLNGKYDCYYYNGNDNFNRYETGFILKKNSGENIKENNKPISVILTDEDIDAEQQAALWYYTNKNDSNYDNYDKTNWLWYKYDATGTCIEGANEAEGYKQITNMTNERGEYNNTNYAELINTQTQILYRYLVNGAKNKTNEEIARLDEVDVSPLTVSEDSIGLKVSETDASKYIIGPLKIDKYSDKGYNLELNVTSGETIDYSKK